MKKLRKMFRQDIVTLPKQSLTAMKVAFGIRAQYVTIAMLSVLMVTQVIGVVIFSGKSQAADSHISSVDLAVATKPATNVSHTTATLNLSSNDLNNAHGGAYSFEYGTDTSYGATTPDSSAQSAVSSQTSLTDGPMTLWDAGYRQARDRHGNIYITPNGNLYKYSPAGQYIRQFGPSYSYGSTYSSMVFDSQDNLYTIGTTTGPVEKFAADGTALGVVAEDSSGIRRIATDIADNLYVLTSYNVYKYNSSGTLLNTFALPTSTNIPCGANITVDSGGFIYVIDADCDYEGTPSKMMKFTPGFELVTEWNAPATFNLYTDANDVIYIFGRTLFTTSGETITTSGPLSSASGESYGANLLGVDVATGTAYGMSYNSPYLFTFNAQARANITGLQCNTTYHYRAKVVVGGETTYGDDQQFTTNCDALSITSSSMYEGRVGYGYSAYFYTNSIAGGPTAWELVSGSLPPGLSLNEYGDNRVAEGLLTQPGSYTFTLKATDNSGQNLGTDQKEFTIEVTGQALEVASHTITAVADSDTIDYQVEATGGHPDYNYSYEKDASSPDDFPAGVYMDYSGHIHGTPYYEGSYTVHVLVRSGPLSTIGVIQFEVDHAPYQPLELSDQEIESGRVGQAYSEPLDNRVYNGFSTRAFEVVGGTIPPGLELDPISGDIEGTPTATGEYTFAVQVSDITGQVTANITINVLPALVNPVNSPIITITSPVNGSNFSYSDDTVTISGTGPKERTITAYIDGYALGTTVVGANGHWEYVAHNIFPGNHTFDAKLVAGGDIGLIPYLSEGGPNSVGAGVVMIDMKTMETVYTVELPVSPLELALSTQINHAGTKAYIAGGVTASEGDTGRFYEVDMATGMITRSVELPLGAVGLAGITISDDDTTAYAMISEANSNIYGIIKIDLQTMEFRGSPAAMATNGLGAHNSLLGFTVAMELVDNKLYSPYSTDLDDEGSQTVTVINPQIGSTDSITILDEPRWGDCTWTKVTQAAGKVYFATNDRIAEVNPANDQVVRTITVAGLAANHDCIIDVAVDGAGQKAYVTTVVGGFVVDLSTQALTPMPLAPRQMMHDAIVEQYLAMYQATMPGYIPRDQLLAGLEAEINQILDIMQNGGNSGVLTAFSPAYVSISSDGRYLNSTSLYGLGYSLNLGTMQYEQISGKVTSHIPGMAYPLGGPSATRRTISPQASIDFSVDKAPVIEPPFIHPGTRPVVDPEETEAPTVTNVTPNPTQPIRSNPIKAAQTVVTAQNSLFALAKRIPEPFAIGFPWVLLSLALGLVGIQYFQVHGESKSTKHMQASVAKQERLVEEQNNFVALSTHYLHTPLTVMEGEITLMVKAGTLTQAEASRLKATLTSLNAEAEAALAQEEQNE